MAPRELSELAGPGRGGWGRIRRCGSLRGQADQRDLTGRNKGGDSIRIPLAGYPWQSETDRDLGPSQIQGAEGGGEVDLDHR